MTDTELLNWFAATGCKWRGWPEWDVKPCRHSLEPSAHGWHRKCNQVPTYTQSLDTHEAACIIRDFLFFHPDMLRHAPVLCDSRSEMSDFLVESVKAVLKEGDGDAAD